MKLDEMRKAEIEIQSKCNRRCAWCPNKSIDRHSEQFQMPENTYLRVLNELKDNDFAKDWNGGYISYSRYNEPMLNIELLKKRVQQARDILPNVTLVSNTNGDYMSKSNLEGLILNELSVMDYNCKGVEYWTEKLKDCGVTITSTDDYAIRGTHKNIGVIKCMIDWPLNNKLETRAGFLKEDIYFKGKKVEWANNKEIRTEPCYEPANFIAIDYNGNVMPCCHFRSDIKEHEPFILGNVNNTSLTDIYKGDKAESFIKLMASKAYEKYPEACRNCQKYGGRYTRECPSIDNRGKW